MEEILGKISQAVQAGSAKTTWLLVQQAMEMRIPPETVLNSGLIDGMSKIGERFKNCDIFVPQVLISARAMNSGMSALRPFLLLGSPAAFGKVCIGTVQGDQHDIGKNLVKMMMESRGLEVVDLGTDVPSHAFADAVLQENCQIVACSALLTTTMGEMRQVIQDLEDAGVRNRVSVMVGGAPITETFCRHIGADFFTGDAVQAAEVACRILNL